MIETVQFPLAASMISGSQMVIILMIVIVSLVMLMNTRRRLSKRGPGPSEYAREQISHLKEQRDVQQDMQGLMVELAEAARRLNAQMDTKAAKLELLIADADRRLSDLRAAQDQPVGRAADRGTPLHSGDPAGTSKSRVLALAGQGRTPAEIAQATNLQPVEVELILTLHGRPSPDPSRSSP